MRDHRSYEPTSQSSHRDPISTEPPAPDTCPPEIEQLASNPSYTLKWGRDKLLERYISLVPLHRVRSPGSSRSVLYLGIGGIGFCKGCVCNLEVGGFARRRGRNRCFLCWQGRRGLLRGWVRRGVVVGVTFVMIGIFDCGKLGMRGLFGYYDGDGGEFCCLWRGI